MRMLQLVFQWQQLFNKATEDVLIVMSKDLKGIDLRQQGLEDKVEYQVFDLLESQQEEINRLKLLVEELKENQEALSAALEQAKSGKVDAGKDSK
jgi:hypothetical protein